MSYLLNISNQEMVEAYNRIGNFARVAAMFNCSHTTVRSAVAGKRTEPNGPPTKKYTRHKNLTNKALIAAYKKYGTLAAAGKALGCHATTVRSAVVGIRHVSENLHHKNRIEKKPDVNQRYCTCCEQNGVKREVMPGNRFLCEYCYHNVDEDGI